ncbi:DUF6802 family protein [Corynebacterium comes]|uniref:DUF6802 domain-containing protein n=1 Tax=Corynebacterium comes TaxID=2675218 RepID=A0A6B8VWI0_9CORY|nr:DUF6802 family protein [Corynebacterium comes]QGU05694.1 hypothetical protein CETAM_12315 [Corynebacterium comes]
MNEWWSSLHGLEDLTGAGDGDTLRLRLGGEQLELDGAVGDSVTLTDPGGTTVYADLDGDGVVDHISSVHQDGGYDVFTADPHRAAWGLVADVSGILPSDGGSEWGLPSDGTPEKGTAGRGENPGKAGWHRIERG